jgi:hypothetical protein
MTVATKSRKTAKKTPVAKAVSSQGLRGSLPKDKRQPAGGESTEGAAIGAVVLKMIASHASIDQKVKAELKQNLRALLPLSKEGHERFRKTLDGRVAEINSAMKSAGMEKLADYFKLNPRTASEYSSISSWARLSAAVQKGWTPDFDESWSNILKTATAVKDTSVATADPKLVQQLLEVRNDAKMDPEQKQAIEQELVAAINENLVPKAPTGNNQSASGTDTPKSLFDQCLALFKDHPLQEVEKCMAQIGMFIAQKANKPAKFTFDYVYNEYVAKASEASRGTKPATKGAKEGTIGVEEHATANPGNERRSRANKHNK